MTALNAALAGQAVDVTPTSDNGPAQTTEAVVEAVEISAPAPDAFPEEETEPTAPVAAAPVVELAPRTAPVAKTAAAPEAKAKPAATSDAKKDDETIRVSLSRLEKLGDLVGELVILQSVVERALVQQPSEAKTRRSLSKLCKDIQEISMALRMVPVAGAFQKLQRIVRDTSKTLNKKVDLKLLGEETEIDRTVLEHLGDPLVHLIRNAVDQGIELPHDRLLAGKTENGTVEVMAFHEGSNLVIQITDDGKGMDPNFLKTKGTSFPLARMSLIMSRPFPSGIEMSQRTAA